MNLTKHVKPRRPFQTAPGNSSTWIRKGHLPYWAVVAMAWVLVWVPIVHIRASTPSEYEVKAAYLYNFGKFVEWPQSSATTGDTHFTICVLGQDPFGPALNSALAGEMIDGRPAAAKRISKPQDALNCRILFISSSEEGQLEKILGTLDKSAVLTVSDIPQFTLRGGIIQFNSLQNRVRFEINLTSAERVGLTLSSQLLKLATRVRKNG